VADGGGFEPPVPFGTHAFQACTIDRSVTHPAARKGKIDNQSCKRRNPPSPNLRRGKQFEDRQLQLQSTKEFVERQLDADEKFAEVRVLGADRIESHFINDRFDLECVAREKRHAPLRIV
jgi:hypothetical protein